MVKYNKHKHNISTCNMTNTNLTPNTSPNTNPITITNTSPITITMPDTIAYNICLNQNYHNTPYNLSFNPILVYKIPKEWINKKRKLDNTSEFCSNEENLNKKRKV